MTSNERPICKPQNLPQPATSSDSERGFGPASNAQQGTNVQFTPAGKVAPSKSGNGGGAKSETK